MSAGRRSKATGVVELAETHNIALAIKRIQTQGGPYDGERWKRAVYHALGMCGVGRSTLEKVRQGLELP